MLNNLPEGFSYLSDPRIICALVYHTHENFVGRPINGYNKSVCIGTDRLVAGVIRAQDDLDKLGQNLVLKILDAYRPQRAVNDFIKWSEEPETNLTKAAYYPTLAKADLFEQGYLKARSTHSRGSAVDLTIVRYDAHAGQHVELAMGTRFDFFGTESHTEYKHILPDARINRHMLKLLMEKHGFKNYAKEWWHYNVVHEQFPETYFDFVVE